MKWTSAAFGARLTGALGAGAGAVPELELVALLHPATITRTAIDRTLIDMRPLSQTEVRCRERIARDIRSATDSYKGNKTPR